jgi:protein-arginine kinase activator protein McsA
MLCDICRQNEAVSEFTKARSPEEIVSRHVCITCLGGWLDHRLADLTDTTVEFYETPPP